MTGGRHSLNAFAKDFVPADFQVSIFSQMIWPYQEKTLQEYFSLFGSEMPSEQLSGDSLINASSLFAYPPPPPKKKINGLTYNSFI